ncbi:MAG: helix-turn-helix domain-containing protein [Proteobacteria bacterium]|nr:helix-turn-helix domain-containing protein [Pseudomonadota bacterium]
MAMEVHLLKRDVFNPPESPVAMARRTPQWSFGMHTHDFSELVVIVGGKGMHLTENEAYPVQRGDVFIITSDQGHGYDQLEDLNLINIYYDMSLLNIPMHDLHTLPGYTALFTLEPVYRKKHNFSSKLRLTEAEISEVGEMVDRMDRELSGQQKGYQFLVCAVFMQIVGNISRCYEQSDSQTSQSLLRISESIGFLENNYDQPITLEQLAQMAHMSKRSFQRVFKTIIGEPPINYLLKLRLSRAKELLLSTRMDITQIAFDTGFNDSNYFARKFKSTCGLSPRQYRRISES